MGFRRPLFSIILPFLLVLFSAVNVFAKLRQFNLTISETMLDPDCNGTAYLAPVVNGQFPAPTLRVTRNDEVEVYVHNEASSPTSIHFHGIRQYGTAESDGVPDVTQRAIPPGHTFVHRFKVVGQSGTFFYHAHVGTQDDSVQGAFIVDDSYNDQQQNIEEGDYPFRDGPYGYHDEFILHLSEWWHDSYLKREEFLLSPEYIFDPTSDSVLINGRTIFRDAGSKEEQLRQQQQCSGHSVTNVLPDRTYRVRVIGGNTFHTYGLGIKGHDMTIIEVDGDLVEPYSIDHLEVTPGQRFSVLITTKSLRQAGEQPSDDSVLPGSMFAIATSFRYRRQVTGYTLNGFGFLRYGQPVQPVKKHYDFNKKQTYSRMRHGSAGGASWQKKYRISDESEAALPPYDPSGKPIDQRLQKRAEDDDDDEGYYDYDTTVDSSDMDDDMPTSVDYTAETDDDMPTSFDYTAETDDDDWENEYDPANDETGLVNDDDTVLEDVPPIIHDNFPLIPDPGNKRDWIWPKLKPLKTRVDMLSRPADRTIKIRAGSRVLPDNTTRYLINGRLTPTMSEMQTQLVAAAEEVTEDDETTDDNEDYFKRMKKDHSSPILSRMQYLQGKNMVRRHLEDDGFEPVLGTYPIMMNETVDIVLQNAKTGRNCVLHPWHTHGHSHYVISSGAGEYDHAKHGWIRNYPNPVYKDVSPVYVSKMDPATEGCGWTKIRLHADNPGVWAVHCHITTHMLLGKLFLLEEATEWIDSYKMYR